MPSDEQVHVGVIGCGAGIFHLQGYAAEPRAKTVALAGLNTDQCQRLAAQFEVPRLYRDYTELLADDDIQAVSIAVPNFLHEPVTIAALEAGKHVLVEKPLARTIAEGEAMVAAARKADRILAIAFNRRHRSDMETLKRYIDQGGLGRIYYAKAWWMRRAGIPGLGTWFTNKELAGGGPLIDLGVHILDMALWLMGNPRARTVSAATYAELGPQGKGHWQSSRFGTGNADLPYEVEDLATAFIRFDGGATLQLETSWAAYTGATDEFGVALMGNRGGGKIRIVDYADPGELRIYSDIGETPVDSVVRLHAQHGHTTVIHRFIDGIINGTPVSPSGEEGLDRVRLIDAIYRSAAAQHEIDIDAD